MSIFVLYYVNKVVRFVHLEICLVPPLKFIIMNFILFLCLFIEQLFDMLIQMYMFMVNMFSAEKHSAVCPLHNYMYTVSVVCIM